MKTVRTILAVTLLVAMCAVSAPAIAGPNGEVNHAQGYTAPAQYEGEVPETWLETFTGFFRFRDLLQLIPLDQLFDGLDDAPGQD